jgi:hypothetical protein
MMHSSFKRDGDYRILATIYVVGRWVYSTSIISLVLSNLFGYQSELDMNKQYDFFRIYFSFLGILTRFLSAKFFVHISKLEYAIYLLNALVVTIVFGTPDSSLNVDKPSLYAAGLVVAVVTYALAVVYTMLFELPFSKLIGEIFSKNLR